MGSFVSDVFLIWSHFCLPELKQNALVTVAAIASPVRLLLGHNLDCSHL